MGKTKQWAFNTDSAIGTVANEFGCQGNIVAKIRLDYAAIIDPAHTAHACAQTHTHTHTHTHTISSFVSLYN